MYRGRVWLRKIEPAISRLMELSSQTTLKQFHRILQIAMGWEDCHLQEFVVDQKRYGTPHPEKRQALWITCTALRLIANPKTPLWIPVPPRTRRALVVRG